MNHPSKPRLKQPLASPCRIAGIWVVPVLLAMGCGTALAEQAKAQDPLLPMCTAAISDGKSAEEALGLYEVGPGSFAADLVDPASAANCLRATPGNLSLMIGDVRLNLSQGVRYENVGQPTRRIVANAIDPVLCESYYTGTGRFPMRLANGSNRPQGSQGVLGGIRTLRFSLGAGSLATEVDAAAFGPWLRCHDATVPNTLAPQGYLWGAGFESNADLRIEILDLGNAPSSSMMQTIGTVSAYRVRVSNVGEVAAADVRVREFLPEAGGSLSPTMTAISCVRDVDSASCADADGLLHQDIASLAPGASVSYTLTREVVGSSELPAESGALTSVAVFSNPDVSGERRLADNSRSLRIGLQTLPSFIVTAVVSGGNGSMNPPTQSVVQNGTASVTLVPAANHVVQAVTDNCGIGGVPGGSLAGLIYSVPNITAACTVTASYVLREYTVTAATSGGNGSVGPASQQVSHGSAATFTVTPAQGYSASLTGCNGVSNNGDGTWSTVAITADCAVAATFSINSYTVTPTVVGGNGTIAPSVAQLVQHGGSTAFALTPSANYRVDSVSGCGGTQVGNNYLVFNVTADCTVTASFTPVTYPVTAAATVNGAITIATPEVAHGDDASFTVTPAVGYSTALVSGSAACGDLVDEGGGSWSAGPIVSAGCELSASFTRNAYLVTVSTTGGNGTIGDPPGIDPVVQVVSHGDNASVAIAAAVGHHPVVTTTAGSCVFADDDADGIWTAEAISGDCTASVEFLINTYTVTAVLSAGSPVGSAVISPSSRQVTHGALSGTFDVFVVADHHIVDTDGSTCPNIVISSAGVPGNPFQPAIYRVHTVTSDCVLEFEVAAD
jgi:hypothetical protein